MAPKRVEESQQPHKMMTHQDKVEGEILERGRNICFHLLFIAVILTFYFEMYYKEHHVLMQCNFRLDFILVCIQTLAIGRDIFNLF